MAGFESHCRFGDCIEVLASLPEELADCCVTSPPYWRMRDYGVEGQIGLENLDDYISKIVEVFRGVRRVLRKDGTLWLNMGDTYVQGGRGGDQGKTSLLGGKAHQASADVPLCATPQSCGLARGNLVGVPWRVALALQDDGWYLRSDIIWHKPNPLPESATNRPSKAHEYIFLLSRDRHYYYDNEAIKEQVSGGAHPRGQGLNPKAAANAVGSRQNESFSAAINGPVENRNKRSVWTVPSSPFSGAHFACYPPNLIKPCILAGSRPGGIVLDPFFGSGTTGRVAEDLGRHWLGIELNEEYRPLIEKRTGQVGMKFRGPS